MLIDSFLFWELLWALKTCQMVHLPYNCRNLFCLYLDNCTFSTFYITESLHRIKYKAPVVRRLDNAIHWINLFLVDIQWIAQYVLQSLIRWIAIYPLDNIVRPLYNCAQNRIQVKFIKQKQRLQTKSAIRRTFGKVKKAIVKLPLGPFLASFNPN